MDSATQVETPHVLQNAGVVAKGNQHTDSTALLVSIEDVLVTERYRQDLGELDDLVSSIVEVGLLNPITVREWHGGYRLVAGERRLSAFKKLGLSEIPVRVARDIADARDALVAERDENTARKEMLPSEKTALGMAIEEMEKPAAAKRQRESVKRAADVRWGNASGSQDPSALKQDFRPRDIAAEAVGMSGSTYRRIASMVKLTKDDEQPDDVREAAQSAIESIDSGSGVRGEYERVIKIHRESVDHEPAAQKDEKPLTDRGAEMKEWHHELSTRYLTPRLAFEAEGHKRHDNSESFARSARSYGVEYRFNEKQYGKHAATSRDRLDRASMSIEVAIDVLSHIDFSTINPEQAEEALQRIDVRKKLGFYIRSLKEITNE